MWPAFLVHLSGAIRGEAEAGGGACRLALQPMSMNPLHYVLDDEEEDDDLDEDDEDQEDDDDEEDDEETPDEDTETWQVTVR